MERLDSIRGWRRGRAEFNAILGVFEPFVPENVTCTDLGLNNANTVAIRSARESIWGASLALFLIDDVDLLTPDLPQRIGFCERIKDRAFAPVAAAQDAG